MKGIGRNTGSAAERRGALDLGKLDDNSKILLATAAVFLVIMLVSAYGLGPRLEGGKFAILREGPLHKIVPLQLKGGEEYAYVYTGGQRNATFTYATWQRPDCIGITQKELKLDQPGEVCAGSDGAERNGSNLSFSDPTIYFFRPWMLAVREGWQWNVSVVSSIGSGNDEYGISFRETGETTYRGRKAFMVAASERGSSQATKMLIDAEKRVLLREEGNGYVIEIISAPFPLGQ